MKKLNVGFTTVLLLFLSSSVLASEVKVIEASYGLNCSQRLQGNMTSIVARACHNKALCHFTVDHEIHGDPAMGCAKTFIVDYTCSRNSVTKTAKISAEATKNYATLDCSQ